MFFLSSVRGHDDLLLTLCILTWTMYLWWPLCKIPRCHFDVRSFVLKCVLLCLRFLTGGPVLRAFWKSASQAISLSWTWIKFLVVFFFFKKKKKGLHTISKLSTWLRTSYLFLAKRNLSSLTKGRSWIPAVKALYPNHWTTREFLWTSDLHNSSHQLFFFLRKMEAESVIACVIQFGQKVAL